MSTKLAYSRAYRAVHRNALTEYKRQYYRQVEKPARVTRAAQMEKQEKPEQAEQPKQAEEVKPTEEVKPVRNLKLSQRIVKAPRSRYHSMAASVVVKDGEATFKSEEPEEPKNVGEATKITEDEASPVEEAEPPQTEPNAPKVPRRGRPKATPEQLAQRRESKKKYYQDHKAEILEKAKQRRIAATGEDRPAGRPKKLNLTGVGALRSPPDPKDKIYEEQVGLPVPQ